MAAWRSITFAGAKAPEAASRAAATSASVTPLWAEQTTSGAREARPATMPRTFSICARLATELPPNFMTIMGGRLVDRARPGSRFEERAAGRRLTPTDGAAAIVRGAHERR